MVRRVALLLFGSGLCALVYQIAWLRELRLVFGASTAASAAVLAIFMGGLGLGGALIGRRASAHPRPLRLYAQLELGVALAAALTPGLVWLARHAYIALGGTTRLGSFGGTLGRLLLSVLVLGVPTVLMGGTLPAAAQAVETEGDVGRRHLAVLYGANALGAVAGAIAASFFLLEIFGTRRTLWVACLLNALVAMIALRLARTAPTAIAPVAAPSGPAVPRTAPARFVLAAAAISGFAFLLLELVWYRMLGPLLGGSSYTFGLILAVALVGIGGGGLAYALVRSSKRATLSGFALSCGLEAAFIALPFCLGDRIAVLAALLHPLGSGGFGMQALAWSLVTAIVVLPAAFVAGVQFPMLVALLGEGHKDVGRELGLTYAWNTVGAIVGSLMGGFGLIPLLSAPGAWRLVIVLVAALGLVATVLAIRRERARPSLAFIAAVLAIVLAGQAGPTAVWRHGAVGAGRAPSSGSPNSITEWAHTVRREVVWEEDGVESSVALSSKYAYAFVVNGKTDGNAYGDAPTQVMAGLLGALLSREPRRALVIGLGTGSTAGWLGAVRSIDRVDAIELEPAILKIAEACTPVNHDVLHNPKVRITLGDARELLLTSREQYDLIFSEPSNPYRAGIASLFTQEFYASASQRLGEDGVFLQWLQSYEVDAQTVRTAYATIGSVFPYVETWMTKESDLLLVASRRPLHHDLARLRARIGEEPYRSALQAAWHSADVEGVFAHFVAKDSLTRAVVAAEGDALSTDDEMLIEFGFARTVGRHEDMFQIDELRRFATRRQEDRPTIEGGTLDWGRVVDRRLTALAARDLGPQGQPDELTPEQLVRARALGAWVQGDLRGALTTWRTQQAPPEDDIGRTLVAEGLAELGDAAALPLVDELRSVAPIVADAILGRLRVRQGNDAEAAVALTHAFEAMRTDPWAQRRVLQRAMRLVPELATKNPALGEQLYAALDQPFAVRFLDEDRRETLRVLSMQPQFQSRCAEVLRGYEPHVPWRREFLTARAACYESTAHPLSAKARAELESWLAASPMPFGAGLPLPQ